MFWTRLLSGIVLVLISLITVIIGGDVLWFTTLVISLIGLWEICKILNIEKSLLGVAGYLETILYFAVLRVGLFEHIALIILAFFMILMGLYVFSFPKYNIEQVTLAFTGFFYVPVMLSFLYQTRMLPDGMFIVWLIFICAWGNDTCAYAVGVLIGKHKMAPVLSPKKSVEGFFGGVVGAAILGAIYAAAVGSRLAAQSNAIAGYAVVCAVGAVIAVVGDLAASAIKRNHNIKDYGKLIPGHGGIMDRFDSMIFTAPAIYYLATAIIR